VPLGVGCEHVDRETLAVDQNGASEVVATPTAPPDAEVVVLVPAPGVTDLLLLTELVLVVLPQAAASMSVAVAPSRRTVNVEPDMRTSPLGSPGEISQVDYLGKRIPRRYGSSRRYQHNDEGPEQIDRAPR
jgi:hypothetical protein